MSIDKVSDANISPNYYWIPPIYPNQPHYPSPYQQTPVFPNTFGTHPINVGTSTQLPKKEKLSLRDRIALKVLLAQVESNTVQTDDHGNPSTKFAYTVADDILNAE